MPPRMPGQATAPTPPIVGPKVASPPAPGQHDKIVPLPVVMQPGPTAVVSHADIVKETAAEVARTMAVADAAREANQSENLPNFANAVTGVYGISGSGKTSLVVTAIEFAWEEFEAISLVYATDLGGFGNKLLSLIRLGIAHVWDPRNHVNSFETMELISLGAWPEKIDDVQTGKADPRVRLILPRRILTTMICPQGHDVAVYDLTSPQDSAAFETAALPCPTCKVVTGKTNCTTRAQIVRHRMFRKVGHRAYDSLTEMNDWGLMRLADMSARGLLPTGKEGGSLLGSADALREGSVTYGGGSFTQVGFMQNRSYQWIANIRGIPDQVMPATCTFAVEQGKADDDSGGVPVLGPQIAGNARTSKVPRWVGNCLHASREPDTSGNMRHRLWLTSHLDARDARKIPYLAKHRGIPTDMPDFLEDPWDDDKAKRDAQAWSICSLKTFYRKLIVQLETLQARDAARYPNAPALQPVVDDGPENDVIGDVSAPTAPPPLAVAGVRVPVTGGQTLGARRGALRMPGVAPAPPPTTIPAVTTPVVTAPLPPPPAVGQPAVASASTPRPGDVPAGVVVTVGAAGAGTADPTAIPAAAASVASPVTAAAPPGEPKPIYVQQLEASLAAHAATQATAPAPSVTTPVAATAASVSSTPASSRLRQPGALRTPGAAVTAAPSTTTGVVAPSAAVAPPVVAHAPVPPAPPPMTVAPPTPRPPARRIPRPPV